MARQHTRTGHAGHVPSPPEPAGALDRSHRRRLPNECRRVGEAESGPAAVLRKETLWPLVPSLAGPRARYTPRSRPKRLAKRSRAIAGGARARPDAPRASLRSEIYASAPVALH